MGQQADICLFLCVCACTHVRAWACARADFSSPHALFSSSDGDSGMLSCQEQCSLSLGHISKLACRGALARKIRICFPWSSRPLFIGPEALFVFLPVGIYLCWPARFFWIPPGTADFSCAPKKASSLPPGSASWSLHLVLNKLLPLHLESHLCAFCFLTCLPAFCPPFVA